MSPPPTVLYLFTPKVIWLTFTVSTKSAVAILEKMPRKERLFCDDPFKKHRYREQRTVQKVPQDVVRLANNPLITEETPICLNCRKTLVMDPLGISR